MRTIYTTVGTSLLGNLNLMTNANSLGELRWNSPREGVLATRFENLKNELLNEIQSNTNNSSICAEIQSTLKAKEKYGDIQVYLICTDSVLSPMCAMGIQVLLEGYKIPVIFRTTNEHIIEGLAVLGKNAAMDYEEKGVVNLFNAIYNYEKILFEKFLEQKKINRIAALKDITEKEELKKRSIQFERDYVKKESESKSIFNISGGYKAVIPIMSIIAQLYYCETIYTYENSDALITINNMPISFDWVFIDNYINYLTSSKTISEDRINDFEKSIYHELVNNGLYAYDASKKEFSKTIIGQLISEYTFKEHPISLDVFGHYVELLVFKYLVKFKESEIVKIEHSVSFKNVPKELKAEIDIYMEKTDGSVIVSEIKSLNNVLNFDQAKKNGKTLLDQIKRQLTQFKHFDQFPVEIQIIIYAQNKKVIDSSKDKLNKAYHEITRIVKMVTNGKTILNMKYFIIDTKNVMKSFNRKRENPNQKIFQVEINQDFIKPLNFK